MAYIESLFSAQGSYYSTCLLCLCGGSCLFDFEFHRALFVAQLPGDKKKGLKGRSFEIYVAAVQVYLNNQRVYLLDMAGLCVSIGNKVIWGLFSISKQLYI